MWRSWRTERITDSRVHLTSPPGILTAVDRESPLSPTKHTLPVHKDGALGDCCIQDASAFDGNKETQQRERQGAVVAPIIPLSLRL